MPANRDYMLTYNYGITRSDFDSILLSQGGGCAVCGTGEPGGRWNVFNVDHNHQCCPTPRGHADCVRGVVCNQCNVRLGYVDRGESERLKKATPEWLALAGEYLRVAV